jgi:MFS family permease
VGYDGRVFLRRYYLYQLVGTSNFFQAMFYVYYQQRAGVDLASILLIQAAYTALRAALDMPFGALADRTSRRWCLAGNSIAVVVGSSVLLVWPSLLTVCIAEALFAIGSALRSGADSALLYDTLHADGHAGRYPTAESRGQAMTSIGSGTTAVVGGLLAAVDLGLPYVATIALSIAGLVTTLRLDERRHGATTRVHGHMRDAARLAWRTPALRWSIAVAVLAITGSHVFYYLQQPFLESIGVPVAAFGVVFALIKLVTAWVAGLAHRVDCALGQRRTTAIMLAVPVVGLGGMALATAPLGAAWMLTRGVLDGLWMPLANVYVNRRVDSRLRATLLSLQSVLARLSLAAALGLLGVASTRLDLWVTLAISAAVIAVISLGLMAGSGSLAARTPCDNGMPPCS